ncbi:MAG: hypothetical protein AB7U75_15665 [Hyphomicrobiaceae bacterium]
MATQFGKSYVEQAADDLARRGEQVSRTVEHAAERATETLGQSTEQLRQAATDSLDRVEIAIRRNPLASTAIAAGLGFFCAVLARR